MSVLFKALQKAEKENEQRQTTAGGPGFDASRLAGSGAIKMAGGGGVNWRTAGIAAAGVLAVAIVGAFFLVQPSPSPAPQVAMKPPAPAPVLQPSPAPESAPAMAAAPSASAPAPDQAARRARHSFRRDAAV